MKKSIIVILREFPYGSAETFLETEIRYLAQFNKVYLCPLFSLKNQQSRIIQSKIDNVEIIKNEHTCSSYEKIKSLIKVLSTIETWKEVKKALYQSSNKIRSIRELLSFSINGLIKGEEVYHALISKINDCEEYIVYSYWFHIQAFVAIYLKNKIVRINKVISRIHGFDLYEERNYGYLPYRDYLYKNVNYIYCVSKMGKQYIDKKYPLYSKKIAYSYLGTEDYGIQVIKRRPNVLKIMSCSNCVQVKRIDLIIDTLKKENFQNLKIEWTHYGYGVLFDELKNKAQKIGKKSISVMFRGNVSNKTLLTECANDYFDVFLNVSSSEGIPVSIMEAMSFGIPVIATNVGGTSEIVIDGQNGYLLPADFETKELRDKLLKITQLDDTEYNQFRKEARKFWLNNFSADKNYEEFVNTITCEGN